MNDLLERIEALLEKATFSEGTIGLDCEQELREAYDVIQELHRQSTVGYK